MAEIVAAALTSHAPLITGRPDIARPEQRERLYAGFQELGRRLAATRPDIIVMFVNDPKLVHFSYRRYMENIIRRNWGFEGTAIKLVFRGRTDEVPEDR